jgi:dUTP pyrophosphatase
MNLKVVKIRPDAKLPTRAFPADAGMDLYFCPNSELATRMISVMGLAIEMRESILLSTGLKIEVPYGHMLEIKNKSGIAYKRQLLVGACVIDSGYAGEIFINLQNIGWKTQYVKAGDKLAQAVLIPIAVCGVEEVTEKEFKADSQRGTGGFGSTGDS